MTEPTDAEINEALTDFAKKLIESQEPLGAEFQKVLNDNRWELYQE